MRYSPSAERVVEVLKKSREQGEDYFRIGIALVGILDLAPSSFIAAALYENDVWPSNLREHHQRVASKLKPNSFEEAVGGGFAVGAFLRDVEAEALNEGSEAVYERHLAEGLARGDLLKQYGINGAHLVERVSEREAEEEAQRARKSGQQRGEDPNDLCFVLMPFAPELASVYTTGIRPAAEEAGLRCARADDIARPGVVLDQIDKSIEEAQVIVADLTGKNPNVMQEVGYARAREKPIVFITQDPYRELPFDTRHYRAQRYEATAEGLTLLRVWLVKSLSEVLRESYKGSPQAPPLKLSLDYVQREIQPQLEMQGYDIIYPLIQRADEYRMQGWEDVLSRDSESRLRPVQTEELAVLMRRNPLRAALAHYSADLRSIEAEWRAERDATPWRTDGGKGILQKAELNLLSLRKQPSVPDSGEICTRLDEIQRDLKQLQGHVVGLDGGRSAAKFWQQGDELFLRLRSVPALIQPGGSR